MGMTAAIGVAAGLGASAPKSAPPAPPKYAAINCAGCGAPLRRFARECEYCRRPTA